MDYNFEIEFLGGKGGRRAAADVRPFSNFANGQIKFAKLKINRVTRGGVL